MQLAEIARLLECQVSGDGSVEITGVTAAIVSTGSAREATIIRRDRTLFARPGAVGAGLPTGMRQLHPRHRAMLALEQVRQSEVLEDGKVLVLPTVPVPALSKSAGGAALSAEVADFLDAAGLTVLGAYGQTEHLCVAMHRPSRYDTETVGPPMPGTDVALLNGMLHHIIASGLEEGTGQNISVENREGGSGADAR